jgi:hypothetical protein
MKATLIPCIVLTPCRTGLWQGISGYEIRAKIYTLRLEYEFANPEFIRQMIMHALIHVTSGLGFELTIQLQNLIFQVFARTLKIKLR